MRLRGAVWRTDLPEPRGHVLLLEGRTEFLEKLCIPAAKLVERGFDVASLDWRGQGLSERQLPETLKGHVDRFESYHADLAALLAHPEVEDLPGPRVVLAHSMGGAIAVGAMLRGRVGARAMVLSAPMLAIALPPALRLVSDGLVALAARLARPDRWAPAPGATRPYVFDGFEGNFLTHDREVFDWIVRVLRQEPRLQLGAAPTLGWLAAATDETAWIRAHGGKGLPCPALTLIGSEEQIVDRASVVLGATRLGAPVVEIAGGRHELLIEAEPMRSRSWDRIDAFLAEQGI